MADAAWKSWERTVAQFFGGRRRGPDTADGKSDIVKPGWSIEAKLLGRIGWQDCLDAVDQAERNGGLGDIPVAVIKRKGDHLQGALVVMRMSEFVERFVNDDLEAIG